MPTSVNVVYNTLKDLVNKDQQGFVTVDEFNRFAQVAQLRIFNRLFDTLKSGSRLARASFALGRDKSKYKQVTEDLAVFAKSADVPVDSGVFPKPSDLARLISLSKTGAAPRTPIELCYDDDKIERILGSVLNAPSDSFPVALISGDVEVFPNTITNVRFRYYKIPQSFTTAGVRSSSPPTYGVAVFGDTDVYNADNSFDFELPEHYTMELVTEIAALIGVNLRDKDVVDYATSEKTTKKSEHSF